MRRRPDRRLRTPAGANPVAGRSAGTAGRGRSAGPARLRRRARRRHAAARGGLGGRTGRRPGTRSRWGATDTGTAAPHPARVPCTAPATGPAGPPLPRCRRPAAPPAPAAPAPPPPDTPPAGTPVRHRSPRTRRQIRRQPLRHRPAHLRIQLPHPRQVLPDRQPQPVRHRRQIQPGEPPGQPRRRRRHERRRARPAPAPARRASPRRHPRAAAPAPTPARRCTRRPRTSSESRRPRSRPRTSACRNRIGPPSSRTTRSPHASFPSERPWLSVSTAIGPPTSTSRNVATTPPHCAASSSDAVAATSPMRHQRCRPSTATTRSISTASARLGSFAGRSPSTTASPVTSSLTPAVLRLTCPDPRTRQSAKLRRIAPQYALTRTTACRGAAARWTSTSSSPPTAPSGTAWTPAAPPAPPHRRRGRRTRRPLPAHGHAPLPDPVQRPRPAAHRPPHQLVARARSAVTGTRRASWRDVTRFLTSGFPRRRLPLAPLVGTHGPALDRSSPPSSAGGSAPTRRSRRPSRAPDDLRELTRPGGEYETYYSSHPAASFAAQVWTNNAQAAAMCLVLGRLPGPPGDLDPLPERAQPRRRHRPDVVRRPPRHLPRPDPPARPAGTHRRLRRRRHRPPPRLDRHRPRPAAPAERPSPKRAGPRSAWP